MAWDSVGPIRVTQQPQVGDILQELRQDANPVLDKHQQAWVPERQPVPVDTGRQEALLSALLAEVQALRAELASRSAYSRWIRFCSWVRTLWP